MYKKPSVLVLWQQKLHVPTIHVCCNVRGGHNNFLRNFFSIFNLNHLLRRISYNILQTSTKTRLQGFQKHLYQITDNLIKIHPHGLEIKYIDLVYEKMFQKKYFMPHCILVFVPVCKMLYDILRNK